MFVRRAFLNDISMFDEEFYLYFEEAYLSYLMAKRGLRSVILPNAKIRHLVGQSSSQMEISRIGLFLTSEFLFFKKVYGFSGKFIVKAIYLLGSLLKLFLKMDTKQIEVMKIVLQS
jgi:GT2 family glycosyltransferase